MKSEAECKGCPLEYTDACPESDFKTCHLTPADGKAIKKAMAGEGWLVCAPNESEFVAAIMPGDGHLEAASWGQAKGEMEGS